MNQSKESLLKECPICAENVKEKAKICRYCNHEFESEEINYKDEMNSSHEVEEDLFKECPYCAENIKKAAIKCKHCGESLEISNTEANQPSPDFIFDGLVDAFEENLEFQIQEGESCQITEVEIGNYSLLIYQSKAMEGLEYLESKTFPGITLSLPLMLKSTELLRFKESDEYDLFSQDSDNSLLGDEFINYYIDLENDTHQAATIVSNVFLNCFKVSSNDFVKLTTNNFPASPETIIETESIQKDTFSMRPAAEVYKPKKNQKKKKSKIKIFIWLFTSVNHIFIFFRKFVMLYKKNHTNLKYEGLYI